jgi:hypothetical protein
MRHEASRKPHDLEKRLGASEAQGAPERRDGGDHAPEAVAVANEILDIALNDPEAAIDIPHLATHDVDGLLEITHACIEAFQPGIHALEVLVGTANVIIESGKKGIKARIGTLHALLQGCHALLQA